MHSGLWCRGLLFCVAWWSCLEGQRGAASPGVCSVRAGDEATVAGGGCHRRQQMALSPEQSRHWSQVVENSQLATCSWGWPGWESQTCCFIPTFLEAHTQLHKRQKGKQVGISMMAGLCFARLFALFFNVIEHHEQFFQMVRPPSNCPLRVDCRRMGSSGKLLQHREPTLESSSCPFAVFSCQAQTGCFGFAGTNLHLGVKTQLVL